MVKKWVPLESNPEVLNEFVSKLGLDTSKYAFCDVFGMDEDLLAMVPQPVAALILCFPVTKESDAAAKEEDEEQVKQGVPKDAELYYMKQTIGNACGTIAVLHSVGNNLDMLKPAPGSFMDEFFSQSLAMDPAQRGRFLEDPPEGAPNIEAAHQAAAAGGDTAAPSAEEEVDLHFVAFVHRQGKLWQLDGRRQGPVFHGSTTPDTLLQDAVKVVQQFVERSNSLNFNLIALAAAGGSD